MKSFAKRYLDKNRLELKYPKFIKMIFRVQNVTDIVISPKIFILFNTAVSIDSLLVNFCYRFKKLD